MGTARVYAYRVLGLDRFKPHLAALMSAGALVLAAASGAPVGAVVALGVFFASLVTVLALVAESVDLDCEGRELTWRSLVRGGAIPIDSISAVDSAAWGFSIARIESEHGNVLVDFGRSKQFNDLVDVMRSLRPDSEIDIRGRPGEPRPSRRVMLEATAR